MSRSIEHIECAMPMVTREWTVGDLTSLNGEELYITNIIRVDLKGITFFQVLSHETLLIEIVNMPVIVYYGEESK